MKRSFSTFVSSFAIVMAMTSSPSFAAEPVSVEQLSAMVEKQQAILEAQAQELQKLRDQLATLNQSQQTQKQQISAQQQEIKAVAAQSAGKPAASQTASASADTEKAYVEVGDFPGSIKLPGTSVSMKIGGQVKVDTLFTPDQPNGLSEDLFQTRTIATAAGTSKSNRSRIHARETRLNLDVRSPTPYGDLRAFTEFDLFGASSSTRPQSQVSGYDLRLRHAFVQVGSWMVGQNWSTFNDPASFAEAIDFAQVNGESFIRQPQIRYTHPLGEGWSFAVAAENPEGDIDDGAAIATQADTMPDVVAIVRTEQNWGHLQAGGLVRRFKLKDATTDDTVMGYGVNLSGKIKTNVFSDKDALKFQINYGDGIGRYINDLQVVGTEAFDAVDSGTDIETLKALGGYVSYQAVFSPKWRANLTGGYAGVDQPSFQPGTAMDHTTYSSASLIWSPFPKMDVGMELLYGTRENVDGSDGEAKRIMGTAKYVF